LTPLTEKIARRSIRSRATRREVAERINAAFEADDIADICQAIADATVCATFRRSRAVPGSNEQASTARSQAEKRTQISAPS
jgi:hypothetical protein